MPVCEAEEGIDNRTSLVAGRTNDNDSLLGSHTEEAYEALLVERRRGANQRHSSLQRDIYIYIVNKLQQGSQFTELGIILSTCRLQLLYWKKENLVE